LLFARNWPQATKQSRIPPSFATFFSSRTAIVRYYRRRFKYKPSGELRARLVMTELLRHPTLELTHALGELMYALGDAGAAAAPHTGAAVHSRSRSCVRALVMTESLRHPTLELTCALGELCARLVVLELLRHPTPELPCTLEDVELMYALDAGVAAAPHAGAAVHSQRCDCCARLGIRGLLWCPHTGAVAHGL